MQEHASGPRPPRLLVVSNTAWTLYNFRVELCKQLQSRGYEVHLAAARDGYEGRFADLGLPFHALPIAQHGLNPVREILACWQLWRLVRRLRVGALLTFTIKPNLYAVLIARFTRVATLINVAGLGRVFAAGGLLAAAARAAYRWVVRRADHVFFQNAHDQRLLGAGRTASTGLLPGSGVNLDRFRPTPLPALAAPAAPITFLFAARLIEAKGIHLYLGAARRLRTDGAAARFLVCGALDRQDPTCVDARLLEGHVAAGDVEYLGVVDDMRVPLGAADCVVLPSHYREGVPRILLEALAAGRAIITTDWEGCRETVDEAGNGWLVAPRDVDALTSGMRRMVDQPREVLAAMGRASRALAEARFDQRVVFARYATVLEDLAQRGRVAQRASSDGGGGHL